MTRSWILLRLLVNQILLSCIYRSVLIILLVDRIALLSKVSIYLYISYNRIGKAPEKYLVSWGEFEKSYPWMVVFIVGGAYAISDAAIVRSRAYT